MNKQRAKAQRLGQKRKVRRFRKFKRPKRSNPLARVLHRFFDDTIVIGIFLALLYTIIGWQYTTFEHFLVQTLKIVLAIYVLGFISKIFQIRESFWGKVAFWVFLFTIYGFLYIPSLLGPPLSIVLGLNQEIVSDRLEALSEGLHRKFLVKYPSLEKVPTPSNTYYKREYSFFYKGRNCRIRVEVPIEIYKAAKSMDKSVTRRCWFLGLLFICGMENDRLYWQNLALSKAQKSIIDNIIKQLHRCSANDDEFVEAAALFVQSIDYDWDSFRSGRKAVRFPVETLVEGRGVCGDKSLLLAAILYYAGYDVALLRFSSENHMGVGVACNCPNFGKYCFIETTRPNPVGAISELYGDISLLSKPEIYQLLPEKEKSYNCKSQLPTWQRELKSYIIRVLTEKGYVLYSPVLDNAIFHNMLPYGYQRGLAWTFDLPLGPPSFAANLFEKCYLESKCGEKSQENYFVKFLRQSKYFGIVVTVDANSYVVKILLAS